MKSKKIDVLLNGIRRIENKYVATIAMNGKSSDVDLVEASLGPNLKEGMSLLNIDSRGSLPGALRGIDAVYTYKDAVDLNIPVELEISTSILTNIRIYAKDMIPEDSYVPDNEVSFVREPEIKNLEEFRWIKGRITGAADGDTFTLVVNSKGEKDIEINGREVDLGQYVKIRLAGIDTRESNGSIEGMENSVRKNKTWLVKNGYLSDDENLQKTFKMASEVESVLKDYFMAGQEILVICDDASDLFGNGYGIDRYERVIGFAYDGNISINKTLLATWSNIFSNENLAEPYYNLEDSGKVASIFPVHTWYKYSPAANEKKEEKQKTVDPQEPVNAKDSFIKENGLQLDKDGFLMYNNGEAISNYNYISNSNNIPADSQSLDYINHMHDDRDELDGLSEIDSDQRDTLYDLGLTRIGDCRLMIPPASIRVSSTSGARQVPTLRSSSSIQTQTGHSTKLIEMTLFFVGEAMINGEEVQSPIPGDGPWYRNGLRPLIAQFKASPFIPVENSLLNDSFGIYSMAFKDMQISTVRGFPDTLQVTLYLAEFDHTIYMPNEEYFSGTINWRMFRWYYQRFMQPSNQLKERTYLGKADIKKDKVQFFIPDEMVLSQRQQAIKDFQYKISPHVYNESNSAEDSLGADIEQDVKEAISAKAQKYLYERWMGYYPESNYPEMYENHVFAPITLVEMKDKDMSEEDMYKYAAVYFELVCVLYNGGQNRHLRNDESKYFNNAPVPRDFTDKYSKEKLSEIDAVLTAYFVPNNLYELFHVIEYVLEVEMAMYGREILVGRDIGLNNINNLQGPTGAALKNTYTGGHYVLAIRSKEAKMYMNKSYGDLYEIKPQDATLVFKMLSEYEAAINDGFDYYEEEFNDLKSKANMTEEDIPVIPYGIGGFVVEGMSMQMSKKYATLQLQSQESPTLQYIGNQDSRVTLQITALDKVSVQQFQQLMRTTQRIARDYRISITSGIITIENELFRLLGIKDFLIESLEVSTPEDNKETFNITMVLTVFSKTQRMRESLNETSVGDFIDTSEDDVMDQTNAYFDARRNNEDFETGVVDVHLRNSEVYPDLELPTYADLNHALPYLNIYDQKGAKFKKMPNPSNGKFLDPDFYIRAVNTRRDNIISMLQNDQPGIYTMDGFGFSAIEYGPGPENDIMSNPNVWFSDETVAWINENLESINFGNTFSNNVDLMGTYNEYEKKIIDHTNIGVVESAYGEDFSGYLDTAKNANIRSSVNIGLTYKDMLSHYSVDEITKISDDDLISGKGIIDVGNVDRKIEAARNSVKNPTNAEVHRELYKLVKMYWPGLMEEYSDEDEISLGNKYIKTYLYGSRRISAPAITIEKILNTLKAVFHVESNWKQFSSKRSPAAPRLNTENGNMGISGVSINCGLFNNLTDIRKAAWDWEYNLEMGVKYFAWCYNKALEDSNPDTAGNPLDWAVTFYYGARRSQDASLGANNALDSDHFYTKFKSIFCQKYGVDVSWFLAVPDAIIDPTLSNDLDNQAFIQNLVDDVRAADEVGGYEEGSSSTDTASQMIREVLKRDRTIAKEYTETGATMTIKAVKYEWGNSKLDDLKVFNRLQEMGEDSKWQEDKEDRTFVVLDPYGQRKMAKDNSAVLEDKINFKPLVKGMDIVEDAVYRHLSLRYDVNTDQFGPVDENQNVVVIKESAYEEISSAYGQGDFDIEKINKFVDFSNIYSVTNIEEDEETIDAISQEIKTRGAISLVVFDEDDIAAMYRSGYNDLLEYDQRGRMLRAFPTFQMFIIDEGRWMTWHKLWDKFYGYNSIISIDVMKDRRIVADTAVIEMSNIYHNLNTHDNSVSYGEWEIKVTDLVFGNPEEKARLQSAIWGLPDDEIIRAYREEMNSLILKPGARIHLRMGYGSNAYRLPVVFNGSISEMNTGEVVTVVAQGDGVELTNKIASNPDETTDGGIMQATQEPRAMICEMLTSKGGFFKNLLNRMSHGVFFNSNPLGIVHFGSPIAPASLVIPNLIEGEDDFGEAGLNVYAGAGINTFSQWIYTEGSKRGENIGIDWSGMPWAEGDEPSVNIYLFDKTPWDIVQIYSSVCPDYVATVLPFEFRSTLFFGKPHWGVMDKYVYQYRWDDSVGMLVKEPIGGRRKALSQFRFYTSYEDIIKNDIKATDMHMYTNVVGVYDEGGKKTMMVQADSDIYTEKQTTAIVDVPIKASGATNFWTQEKYALSAATTTLSNYMREMYQGELTVMGDPAVKPHDTMYLADTFSEMTGNAWIKRVTHHFSFETGFISNITPDCVSIIDDRQVISYHQWFSGGAINITAGLIGIAAAAKIEKAYNGRIVVDTLRKYGSDGVDKVILDLLIEGIDDPVVRAETLNRINDLGLHKDMLNVFNGLEDKNLREAIKNLSENFKEEYLDEVIDVLDTTGRKKWAALFKTNRAVGRGLSKSLGVFASYIDEPAKIGRQIDNVWNTASNLGQSIEFFQKKGLIRSTLKTTAKTSGKIVKGTTKFVGTGSARILKGATKLVTNKALMAVLGGVVADLAFTVVAETVIETWQRYLKSRQAVLLMPLKYRGREFTAGINGHRGAVIGDSPGKIDKFLEGSGALSGAVDFINGIAGVEVDYSTSDYDKEYLD